MVYHGNRYNWTAELKERLKLDYGPYGAAVVFSRETGIPLTAVYKMAESMGLRQTPRDWYISPQGYKIIGKMQSRKPQHRLVLEGHLNRTLSSGEIVHHLDGNKLNNVLSNLVITTRAKHINIHRNGGDSGIQRTDRPR